MKKGLIPRLATYRCQSPYYNEDSMRNGKSRGVVWIRAALNDGIPECWKDEDEIERSTDFPGLERSTDFSGLERSTDFPGLERSTDFPGLERSTDIPGLERST